jgi:hypothetical protein
MPTVRSLRRALGALSVVLLAAAASLAAVVPAAQAASGKTQQPPLAISITGMTPAYATPDATVKVTGTLANHSGAALPGIEVLARTSFSSFQFPAQMTDFTNGTGTGTSVLPLLQAGEAYQVPDTVPNGATVRWSVSFLAGSYSQFGVYPIDVQAFAGGTTYTADARTLLPFWPGNNATNQPKGLQVAWVWPLVDTPQQGVCPQMLATKDLAGSVASGGRLSTLLNAGAAWSQKDDLTWNIDPALLSDVSVMTKPYFTSGQANCSGRFKATPSTAASNWLSQLKTTTAGASAFLTPYANVDAASLSHAGLDQDILKAAYRLGDSVAGQILPQTFGKTGTGTGDGQVLQAAWPADGKADAEVLTNLANDGGISTVVLSSDAVPSSAPGEDALARTVSGIGTNMSLLLANSRITSLLGTASKTKSPSGQFALTQNFLAQTAMIATEVTAERSLVVAPPTNWDPTPAAANALLAITNQAPWLHSTGLSTLAASAAKLSAITRLPAQQVSPSELSDDFLDKLGDVVTSVDRFKSILYKPSPGRLNSLDAALVTTASSAWRGKGSPGGWRAYGQLAGYLQDAEGKVRLVASKKILLAGQSGETAVSVQNGLGEAVQVRVTASTPPNSEVRVEPFNSLLKVQASGSNTVRMPVHSSTPRGTTTIRLQLATPTGAPLAGAHATQSLSVEVTRFGRFLLIIIGGALGILVLTSAYRLRRKRLAGAKKDGSEETAEAGGTG